MNVILLRDVPGIGRKDEIHDVSAGYARNFLLPRKAAVLAQGQALSEYQQRQSSLLANAAEKTAAVKKIIERVPAVRVTIAARANEQGELYGSITAKTIVEALAKEGMRVPESAVHLERPITHIGEHSVLLQFSAHDRASFSLIITSA